MRKIIVISMISLDGVMQAPGGPEEDTSGGFEFGGWTAPYMDEVGGRFMEKQMKPADYLLGRKTYDIWASYWPEHAAMWPGINDGIKYVLSGALEKSDPLVNGWNNTVFLKNLTDIKNIKNTTGADIQVWGSSKVVQLLLKHDLADELRLVIYPVTLGEGKKLFDKGISPAAFTLIESIVTPGGLIIACYTRAGKVKTGTVGS